MDPAGPATTGRDRWWWWWRSKRLGPDGFPATGWTSRSSADKQVGRILDDRSTGDSVLLIGAGDEVIRRLAAGPRAVVPLQQVASGSSEKRHPPSRITHELTSFGRRRNAAIRRDTATTPERGSSSSASPSWRRPGGRRVLLPAEARNSPAGRCSYPLPGDNSCRNDHTGPPCPTGPRFCLRASRPWPSRRT